MGQSADGVPDAGTRGLSTESRGSVHPGYFSQLPYTARNLYNAGLFYAGYGFKFSLAANFVDRPEERQRTSWRPQQMRVGQKRRRLAAHLAPNQRSLLVDAYLP
jgi:hypothetical protein